MAESIKMLLGKVTTEVESLEKEIAQLKYENNRLKQEVEKWRNIALDQK